MRWIHACLLVLAFQPVAAWAATGWVERLEVSVPPPVRLETGVGVAFRFGPDDPPPQDGFPDLAALVRPIRSVPGYQITVQLVASDFSEESGVNVAPALSLHRRLVGDNRYETSWVREKNPSVYDRDIFWPESQVAVDQAWMGTNRVARLVCRPLQWNPQTMLLRVYSRLVVELRYQPE
jgi:hypothetical protein